MTSASDKAFRACLKGMDSTDLPDLGEEPPDPLDCCIEVNLRVGTCDKGGADNFLLYFVTPRWLTRKLEEKDHIALEYTVVIQRFSWSNAERAAQSLLASHEAQSWTGFVEIFSRFAYWEYSREPWPSMTR